MTEWFIVQISHYINFGIVRYYDNFVDQRINLEKYNQVVDNEKIFNKTCLNPDKNTAPADGLVSLGS